MAIGESKVAAGVPAPDAYPVVYTVAYPRRMSRRKGVQRAIGALLGWAVPAGLGYVSAVFYLGLVVIIGSVIAAGVIGLPLFLALRIRSRGARRFLTEDGAWLERTAARAMATAAYSLFLTDDSPKQALGSSVRFEVRRGGRPGWLRAAVTPVLLLPHIALLAAFAFVFTLVIPVCAVSVIAFQRYPHRWLFAFTAGYLRWIARALGYWVSLTDRYPPFSFA